MPPIGLERSTRRQHITLLAGAGLLGALLAVAPAHAAENKWPGTKAGEPTPFARKLTPVSNNRKEFGRVPRLAIENWADRA